MCYTMIMCLDGHHTLSTRFPRDAAGPDTGFDTNFYEQWSTGPPAQRIWWSYNFFSGPDKN